MENHTTKKSNFTVSFQTFQSVERMHLIKIESEYKYLMKYL